MTIIESLKDSRVFAKSFAVETYNTSYFQTIKISDLFKYLQEVAALHSESMQIGFNDLMSASGAWVLTKQLVKINRLPKSLEKFKIHTWSHKHNKIIATRNFVVTDSQNKIIIEAVSDWVVIDVVKRRIIPLSKINLSSVMSYDLQLFSEDLKKIDINRHNLVNTFSKKARFSDIDMNGHMNNTCYIDMILDSLAEHFDKHYSLQEIDTNFIQEVKYLQEISIKTYLIDTLLYHHEIISCDDGKQVFTATTRWAED